jgi:hypothetical protein
MLGQLQAVTGWVFAASCFGILVASDASACDPVAFCSAVGVCSRAPAPWGSAIREATAIDDPNLLLEKTADCVRRSNFQGIGRYAKDWDRIADCGGYPERYLNWAHAAEKGAWANVR